MCPVCIATVALIAGGTTSVGGLTAFVVEKLHAQTVVKKIELMVRAKGGEQDGHTNAEQVKSS